MSMKLRPIKLILAAVLAGCFAAAAVSTALDPYKTPSGPISAALGIAVALLCGYFALFAYNFDRRSRGLDLEGKLVPNKHPFPDCGTVALFMVGVGAVIIAASTWWAGGWVFDKNFPVEFRLISITRMLALTAQGVLLIGIAFGVYVFEQVLGARSTEKGPKLSRESTWRRLVLVNAAALGAVVFSLGHAAGSAVRWNIDGLAVYSIVALHFALILAGSLLLDLAARGKKEGKAGE
jgi:hypothetical protein